MDDKPRKLTHDRAAWLPPIVPDDFLVMIGQKKTNSVYHIAEVVPVPKPAKRIVTYKLTVYKTDLMTALSRDKEQKLIPAYWYRKGEKRP